MKNIILPVLFIISLCANAQSKKYYRQLRYNHVSPYVDIKGIYPIDSLTASHTSHYIFKYNSANQLREVINNHYFTERVHPLASLGAYKVVFNYANNKETRTFFNPNNQRITNDRNVYKEVYILDKNKNRKQLNFYDLEDNPMESNWEIAEYQWTKSKKYIVERRFNLNKEPVNLSPYFKFGVTGIVLTKSGNPKIHYNLDSDLKITENETGVASYQDTYDKNGNHIKYSYHDKNGNLVMNQWNFAIGNKVYDSIGNYIKLNHLDTKQNLLDTRYIYSNATVKISPVASKQDSLKIKQKSLGYLVALQKLNPVLMGTVLNDSLNKVTIGFNRKNKREYGKSTTKKQMIVFAKAWNKRGTRFPFNPSNTIQILDIYNKIATVKLVSDNWVEYLQLIKLNGSWEIMNLLWQYKDIKRYDE